MKKIHFRPRHVWLILIGLLSAFLDFWNLSKNGYANTYYAAAVKSMLQSFHNFFFLSFDPSGFITVDKPPVGFWLQTLSAWIFGFHGWSILAPEALSGVISVLILYHLVAKKHGYIPGLIAAFLLAMTPLSVATNRNNTIDSILTTALLVAAWALLKAADGGQRRLVWLLISAGVLGIGFNIKFAEAYLVLPALIVGYLFVKELKIRTKLIHLVFAACVLTVVSFSWSVIVDAVPAQDRPWVGSTQTNSEVNLALGYDGLQRVTGTMFGAHGGKGGTRDFDRTGGNHSFNSSWSKSGSSQNGPQPSSQTNNSTGSSAFGQSAKSGQAGYMNQGAWPGGPGQTNNVLLRLFTGSDGAQVGWWLPLGIVGFVLALLSYRRRKLEGVHKLWPSLAMWSTWFATTVLYFTFVAALHTYYMVTMAPAIAAMVGIGYGEARHYLRDKRKVVLGVVVLILGMAAYQLQLLWSYTNLRSVFELLLCLGGAAALIALILTVGTTRKRLYSWMLLGASLFNIAIIPAYWSYSTLTYTANGSDPTAGPSVKNKSGSYGFGGGIAGFGQSDSNVNEKLLSFLKAHYQGGYLLVTQNATSAAPYILDTGLPVMAMGGFRGTDPAITSSQLQTLAKEGKVKYFLVSTGGKTSGAGTAHGSKGSSTGFGGYGGDGAGYGDFAMNGDFPNFADRAGSKGGYAGFGGFGSFGSSATQSQNLSWIEKNCKLVPTSEWENTSTTQASQGGFSWFGGGGGGQLYEYVGNTAAK